jgi:hypothetical protein
MLKAGHSECACNGALQPRNLMHDAPSGAAHVRWQASASTTSRRQPESSSRDNEPNERASNQEQQADVSANACQGPERHTHQAAPHRPCRSHDHRLAKGNVSQEQATNDRSTERTDRRPGQGCQHKRHTESL